MVWVIQRASPRAVPAMGRGVGDAYSLRGVVLREWSSTTSIQTPPGGKFKPRGGIKSGTKHRGARNQRTSTACRGKGPEAANCASSSLALAPGVIEPSTTGREAPVAPGTL